jgi:hypothetical protein
LITESRKKEETIWPDFMADLLAVKTLIQVLKADPTYFENVPVVDD